VQSPQFAIAIDPEQLSIEANRHVVVQGELVQIGDDVVAVRVAAIRPGHPPALELRHWTPRV
jgi:hypothetical protein